MPGQLYKSAAIVGAAEANEIGFLEKPVTALQLHIEAIKNVCEQTGIAMNRIEGVFSTQFFNSIDFVFSKSAIIKNHFKLFFFLKVQFPKNFDFDK